MHRFRHAVDTARFMAFIAAALASAQCTAPTRSSGGQCVFNDDCTSPLVCAGRYCRAQCNSERDCPSGYRCTASDQPDKRVCLPPEAPSLCVFHSDCPSGLFCTRTGECGAECRDDRDCRVPGTQCLPSAASPMLRVCMHTSDGGTDAGADASVDAGVDAGMDAASEGGLDASMDAAPPDTGAMDAGTDAPRDAVTADIVCTPGSANCNGLTNDLCEVDLASNPLHCGACNNACPVPANGVARCSESLCDVQCNAGYGPQGGTCVRHAPRPIAPTSGARVTATRPTVRWQIESGTTASRVDFCKDRACTQIESTVDVPAPGNTAQPMAALSTGTHFWRVREVTGTGTGVQSHVWEFFVGRPPTGVTSRVQTALGRSTDFNGDGFGDLVLAAESGGMGRILIYNGSPTGLATAPREITAPEFRGTLSAGIGDFDGDGFPDYLIDASNMPDTRVLWGSSSGLSQMQQSLPQHINMGLFAARGIGDTDGDGRSEYVVGTGSAAYLYRGGFRGPSIGAPQVFTQPGGTPGNSFGSAISSGDFNSDGHSDLIIGSSSGTSSSGSAFVYYGSVTGLSPTPSLTLTSPTSNLGIGVSAEGDFNGDGYADALVSTNGDGLYIHFGSGAGLQNPGVRLHTMPSERVVFLGDINGDGFDDVASRSNGAMLIYHGQMSGVPTSSVATLNPNAGLVASPLGDVNNDGFADFYLTELGQSRAWVYFGGNSGVSGPLVINAPTGTTFGRPL